MPIHEPDAAITWREPETDLFTILCERKGWTQEYLDLIEVSAHEPLKDLDTMVDKLHEIKLAGREVSIAPDFDMDGIASGVLGYAGLSELGFKVNLQLPDYTRGHDLTVADIEEIKQLFPNTSVLLTCDGGVNSHEGIAAARALGWTTLVTDHHEELDPGSTADITVDPCRLDESYSNRGICGAYVLFQVLEAYALKYSPYKLWEICLLRVFAGLGTVSDVMPILYENRQLVRDSLSVLRLLYLPAPRIIPNPYNGFDPDPEAIDPSQATLLQLLAAEDHHPVFMAALEGVAVMLKAFGIAGKVRDIDSINEGFYGFYLAPVMNSPRRTGAPLHDCFTVFLPGTPDEKLEAIQRVIANNELRKEMTVQQLEMMTTTEQPLAPWVYFSDAPTGMFGLLANQIMSSTGNPAVVVKRPTSPDSPTGGSGRAPSWYNIISELEANGNPDMHAVGHQQACGVKVSRAGLLGELARTLQRTSAVARERAQAAGTSEPAGDLVLGAGPECDAPLEDVDALIELVRRINSLTPFGQAFEEPRFEIVVRAWDLRIDTIGSEKQHMRVVTKAGIPLLWWNSVEKDKDRLVRRIKNAGLPGADPLRFMGKLQLNDFRGEVSLQVVVDELLEPSTPTSDEGAVSAGGASLDEQ